MPSPKIWAGYHGEVSCIARAYPLPCGSSIFGEVDPLAPPAQVIDNTYMTFSTWTIAPKMEMLERNVISSRGRGFYPTLLGGTVSLTGVISREGSAGLGIGLPIWMTLKLTKGAAILGTSLPVIISSLTYTNDVTGAYSVDIEAEIDWSFDMASGDAVYSGWVTTTATSITPIGLVGYNYPFVLKGLQS